MSIKLFRYPGFLIFFKAHPHYLVHDRYYRDDDNDNHYQGEIFFHEGEISEEVSREQKDCRPQDAAEYVIGEELGIGHLADTRNKGHEGPDDGSKPAEYNG